MMKKLTTAVLVSALTIGTAANASDMILDLSAFGGNMHDAGRFVGASDAGSATSSFTEFGFNQILATSVYDFTDGSALGSFYDTNIPAELTAVGISGLPAGTSGLAMDGLTTVSLFHPNTEDLGGGAFAVGQSDIDALSPLVPPLATDNEGFLQTWDLQVAYHFDGTLTAGGPVYTGGTFDVYFNSLIDDTKDGLAFSGVLTSSTLNLANLDLFFDITWAATGFLNIWDGSSFVDASLSNGLPSGPTLALDTNVNPPIPTADQLLLIGTNAIRQTTLDGSITAQIPEPSTVALLGLGVIGLGAGIRRRRKS